MKNHLHENLCLPFVFKFAHNIAGRPQGGSMSRRVFYEVGWTDSWTFRRCCHIHDSLIDAAKCGMPRSAGWYVFAVENGRERELSASEDKVVDDFRFGRLAAHA